MRGGIFGPADQAAFYRNIVRARVGDLVAAVKLTSLQAAAGWSERDIGLLWLDGDHRYSAVRADFLAWSPFVAPSGIIAFHDTDTDDVERLLRELVVQHQLQPLGHVGSLSWFGPL